MLRLAVSLLFFGGLSPACVTGSDVATHAPTPAHEEETATSSARRILDHTEVTGVWHLTENESLDGRQLRRVTLRVWQTLTGEWTGDFTPESGPEEPADAIEWDSLRREVRVRRHGPGFWRWYQLRVTEGVAAGRYAHSAERADAPTDPRAWLYHVTGWNQDVFDAASPSRVYDGVMNNVHRYRLRIDRDARGALVGRLKLFAFGDNVAGEEPEYDVAVTRWDESRLEFVRHVAGVTQTFRATVSGATLQGTYSDSLNAGSYAWQGRRANVLTYGLVGRSPTERARWQEATRRRLELLMMAGNPDASYEVEQSGFVEPAPQPVTLPLFRDDDPAGHPPDYTRKDVTLRAVIPTRTGSTERVVHGVLSIPNDLRPGERVPAVVALNGHNGSAALLMDASHHTYWYGDAFARRRYVVFAVDVFHRPLDERHGLYAGDLDPSAQHASIRSPDMNDSDWEEDGERVWDAHRAVHYVRRLPFVDAERVMMVGLSMGGEVTLYAAALDPTLQLGVVAGFAPDFNVMRYRGNHRCFEWAHADLTEYVDASDLGALVAPRPLLIQSGAVDFTFSVRTPPFAADKQVLRRVRAAYGADLDALVHNLHDGGHAVVIGGSTGTDLVASRPGIRVPVLSEPGAEGGFGWQLDPATSLLRDERYTVFDWVTDNL